MSACRRRFTTLSKATITPRNLVACMNSSTPTQTAQFGWVSRLHGCILSHPSQWIWYFQRKRIGTNEFGLQSTFKTNHFLGYTLALNKLDGVFYVDPIPDMLVNELLREQIHGFQQFLVNSLWILTQR